MMIKGFGGIFWRTKNVDAIKKWYSEALNLDFEGWNGTIIKPQSGNETIFSFFTEDDLYFPPEQQVMLNFQSKILMILLSILNKWVYLLKRKNRRMIMVRLFGLKTLKVD